MSKIQIAAKFRCFFGEKVYERNSDKLMTRFEDIDQINMSNIKSFVKNYETVGYKSIECIESFALDNTKKLPIEGTVLEQYTVDYFNNEIKSKSKVEKLSVEDENKLLKDKVANQEKDLAELKEQLNALIQKVNNETKSTNKKEKTKKIKVDENKEDSEYRAEIISSLKEREISFDENAEIDILINLLEGAE